MRLSTVIRHLTSAIVAFAAAVSGAMADPLAKDAFGAQRLPAATQAAAHGFYSKGCFAGGMAIATDGPNWQAMRLSRNRRWGHPEMIALLERFSREAAQDGWPGLLIGDAEFLRSGGRIPTSDDGNRAVLVCRLRNGLGDLARADREEGPFKNPHRAVPDDGAAPHQSVCESLARVGADVEAHEAVGDVALECLVLAG